MTFISNIDLPISKKEKQLNSFFIKELNKPKKKKIDEKIKGKLFYGVVVADMPNVTVLLTLSLNSYKVWF